MDEPTTGLHLADSQKRLDCLKRLVDAGHTVVVIGHQLDGIKFANYIVDLGPESRHKGGEIMAQGTPEKICEESDSHTGLFLQQHIH